MSALAVAALALLGGASAAQEVAAGFSHAPPASVDAGGTLVVEVKVKRPKGVRRGRVRYRAAGATEYQKADMALEGDVLKGVIPPGDVKPPALEYYVVVQTGDGKVLEVVASPAAPYALPVTSGSAAAGDDDAPKPEVIVEETLPEPSEGSDPLEEGTARAASGASAIGRRLPGGAGVVDSEGDPLVDEMAVYAAEDEGSLVVELLAEASVPPEAAFVVERAQIERMGARTLLDVLDVMPGISTSLDVLGFPRVALRGLRGDARLAFYVDGQRVYDPYDGRAPLDLPADLIERVELIASPLPGALPAPAPFGAVRVTTRRTQGLAWRLYGGSFTTVGSGGGAGVRFGGFSLFGSGSARYTEGPRLAVEHDSWSKTRFSRDGELFTNAKEVEAALALGTDLDLGGTTLYGRGHAVVEQRGPYVGAFDTVGEESELLKVLGGGKAGVRVGLGDLGHVDVGAHFATHVVDRRLQLSPREYWTPDRGGDDDNPACGELESPGCELFPEGVRVHQAYSALALGLTSDVGVRLFSGNELKGGFAAELAALPEGGFTLEMNRDTEGVAQNGLGPVADLELLENQPCGMWGFPVTPLGACRATVSLYVGDAWQVIRGLYLDAGLALTSFSDVDFDLLTHLSPHAGVSWTMFERFTLRAHAATGIRPPTWEERFDQSALGYVDFSNGAYVGAVGLVPEIVRRVEGGADYRFPLGEARYTLSITAFGEQVERAVEEIDLTGTVEQPGNHGSWEMVGVEGGGRAHFAGGSFAYVNASWFRGYFRAPYGLDEEEPVCAAWPWEEGLEATPCSMLTSTPQLRANLGVNLDLGLVDLHAWSVLGAERRNNVRSTLERLRPYRILPYALVNLSARSKPLFDVVGVELSAFNLLDHAWRDDVPRPDRMTGLLPREGLSLYGGVFVEL